MQPNVSVHVETSSGMGQTSLRRVLNLDRDEEERTDSDAHKELKVGGRVSYRRWRRRRPPLILYGVIQKTNTVSG